MSERAERKNSGKPQLHAVLCFPEAMRGIARITAYGAVKYARYNFMKGAPASEHVDSALRHLLAWWSGEDVDNESGLSHLDAFAWNACRLATELQGPLASVLDDRPKAAAPPPATGLTTPWGTLPSGWTEDASDQESTTYSRYFLGPGGLRAFYAKGRCRWVVEGHPTADGVTFEAALAAHEALNAK